MIIAFGGAAHPTAHVISPNIPERLPEPISPHHQPLVVLAVVIGRMRIAGLLLETSVADPGEAGQESIGAGVLGHGKVLGNTLRLRSLVSA